MPQSKKLSVNVTMMEVVSGTFIAVTQIAGITIRGRRANTAQYAVRNLFHVLANASESSDDALLALDLLVEGTTLNERLALEDGE